MITSTAYPALPEVGMPVFTLVLLCVAIAAAVGGTIIGIVIEQKDGGGLKEIVVGSIAFAAAIAMLGLLPGSLVQRIEERAAAQEWLSDNYGLSIDADDAGDLLRGEEVQVLDGETRVTVEVIVDKDGVPRVYLNDDEKPLQPK